MAVDAITRLPFPDVMLRTCPHPAVQKRYGAGCKVSVYTCKRCKHGERHGLFDGWGCAYSTDESK